MPPPSRPFIALRGVEKSLGTPPQPILRGVDLDIRAGETLCLIGPSGEGKSVLLKHMIGLLQPDAGSVVVDGIDITAMRERQLIPVRRKIGILFQNGALFDSMTVAENVAFPLAEQGVRDRAEIGARVEEALEVVGLAGHRGKMPIDLSGGMRKRAALARAIISRPRCLLYDEPTAGLDPIATAAIDDLILCLQERYGVTSVVITHHLKSVEAIADRAAFLWKGKVYFAGTPQDLHGSPDPLLRAFIEGRPLQNE